MKKLLLVSFLAIASFSAIAADAPNPNVMPPIASVTPPATLPAIASGSLGQLGGAVVQFLSDAQPFYGTSNAVVYDAVALYNSGHVGGLISAHVPITALSTNGQIAAGAAIAYFKSGWYSLALNAEAGTTWQVPVLGSVYTSIGSGPDFNFKTQTPGAFSYLRAEKNWDISKGHKLGLTAGIGNETSVTGIIFFGGLTLGW